MAGKSLVVDCRVARPDCGELVSAAVKLPGVIGDNMVLQHGQSLPIWGWASPGDEITVSIAGQEVSAKAGPTDAGA